MSDYNYEDAHCPACGEPIQYCTGHGSLGDPYGAAVLELHDQGLHDQCHPFGECQLTFNFIIERIGVAL